MHIAHGDGLIAIFLPCPRLNIGHGPAKARHFADGERHIVYATAHEIDCDINLLDGRIAALGASRAVNGGDSCNLKQTRNCPAM